jgi:hypothetical protein
LLQANKLGTLPLGGHEYQRPRRKEKMSEKDAAEPLKAEQPKKGTKPPEVSTPTPRHDEPPAGHPFSFKERRSQPGGHVTRRKEESF